MAVRVRRILSGKRKPRFDTPGLGVALTALLVTVLLYMGSAGSRRPGPAPAPRPEPPVLSAPPAPEPRLEPPPAPVLADTEAGGCPEGCTVPPPGCDIKGNISQRTGERIYHLPSGEYYGKTVIRPEDGERWFCSEGEARVNGWRKSKR